MRVTGFALPVLVEGLLSHFRQTATATHVQPPNAARDDALLEAAVAGPLEPLSDRVSPLQAGVRGAVGCVAARAGKRRLRTSGASLWTVVSALLWNRLDERPQCGAKSRKFVEDAFAVEAAAGPVAAAPERVTFGS